MFQSMIDLLWADALCQRWLAELLLKNQPGAHTEPARAFHFLCWLLCGTASIPKVRTIVLLSNQRNYRIKKYLESV